MDYVIPVTVYERIIKGSLVCKEAKIYIRERGICHYCDREVIPGARTGRQFTMEHIKAKSKGGSDEIENLACACRRCNTLRGNAPYEWFLWFLENYGPENLPEWNTKAHNRLTNQIATLFRKGVSRSKRRIRMTYRKDMGQVYEELRELTKEFTTPILMATTGVPEKVPDVRSPQARSHFGVRLRVVKARKPERDGNVFYVNFQGRRVLVDDAA